MTTPIVLLFATLAPAAVLLVAGFWLVMKRRGGASRALGVAAVVFGLLLVIPAILFALPVQTSTEGPERGEESSLDAPPDMPEVSEAAQSEPDWSEPPCADSEGSEVAPPEIDDPISCAELEDLKAVARQYGMSLQAAIDRYAWNDNFALAVQRVREAAPAVFAGAEIVDAGHAWVAFTGSPPRAALDIIDTFTSSHRSVSVEVRADLGFSEAELEEAVPAVHYAVLEAPEVLDATTSFDSATGQIRTTVVLETTASDSLLDDLRAIATKRLIDVTRSDILDSITISVVRSDSPVLGGYDGN